MAIVEEVDRRTKRTTLLCEGTVTAVYVNKLSNVKTYTGQQGKSWTPTHSVNIVVDGDRVSMGLTDKPDNLRVKNADDKYVDFGKGLEITLPVEKGEEYNGKPQYTARLSDVCVVGGEAVVEQATKAASQPAAYSGKPKDTTGIQVGHALNIAFDLIDYKGMKDALAVAQDVHTLTLKLKAEYAAEHPKMSEYDVGACVGHAVSNGAKFAKAKGDTSVEQIEKAAKAILSQIVPAMDSYVRNGLKTQPEAQEAPQEEDAVQDSVQDEVPVEKHARAVKSKAPAKRTPKIVQPDPDGDSDDDDLIPF